MDQSTRLSAISPVEDGQIDDFVQLNSQGLNRSPGKTDKVKAAILESPMEDDNHIIHQTLSQMIKKLEPCEVSPCQTQTILSSNEKKEEENKLWQQEKYLSEITRLTLQEPSCTKEATIEDSTISVIKELGLQGEDIECDLELQLPWDPLSASTKEITHHRKLLDTLSLGQQDMVEDREIYIKYETQLFLYDWQEQTLVAENRYEKGERGEEMVEATSHAEQNATEEKIPILSKQSDGTEAMVTQDGFTSLQLHTIDPLDNFMMLRQGIVKRSPILPKKNQSPAGKPRAVLKTPEIRQCLDKQASPCSNTSITSTPKRDSLKKNKSRVVTVKMPDEFNDLVSLFESACKEAIMILRHQNAISTSYTFSSLTPDVTRFLLKQQEKLMGQNNQESLASIQRQLFKQQFVFHERQVIHPKLTELGHQIGKWFYRKMQKGDGDQDPKILVIVRRDFDGLSPIIVKTLENIKGIHTGIAELPTDELSIL
ncbi:uncharacterized protein [Ptychodera flava]|uniref:uncharacterized protein isoform X2 n=1 Tax=Ptychodera flava TaxID=63121 RepID=UPI00396A3095